MSNLPRTIESDLQSTNLGLNSAWLRAQNRYKWRSVVETAMLTPDDDDEVLMVIYSDYMLYSFCLHCVSFR